MKIITLMLALLLPTLAMLEEHWPAVEALAEALVDQGRIEGDQVEAIIDGRLKQATMRRTC